MQGIESRGSTLLGLLRAGAGSHPNSPAIEGAGRSPLSYRELYRFVELTAARLGELEIGRGDRIALVLPNGPEMATAFLAVAACAASAPLNPAYRAEEFDFYLSDLRAKALLVEAASDSPATGVARARGIPVVELHSTASAPAGVFTLVHPHGPLPAQNRERERADPVVQSEDVALLLHTSGTTSRPKLVPLTQANLLASAGNVAASLALTEVDRCLNVMPLFHIHGLVAALVGSLWAGGSVICTPGFQALQLFDWLEEFRPTWYTAVPTMHQSILAQARRNPGVLAGRRLRFVRSSSAPLAPQLMVALEDAFQAPVIEAYGMTEAAHQMASNPLPPRERKPGTVGPAAGPEIAVMDDEGNLLPAGLAGEVVIRGPNVTPGYEGNPAANAAAFTNGWFRTGDQGVLDQDGYLKLTGRLKEIINRGGEKISPREIDEVLLDHPAVAQAVTFAIPDPRLGEDLGAAIVLRPGSEVASQEIRMFAAGRLADFKVPTIILFVDEIPKGPTGKQQRIGLVDKLGIRARSEAQSTEARLYEAPRSDVERLLAGIWAEVLRIEKIGAGDDFLALGGDSVLAAQVVSRIRDKLGVELPLASFFSASSLGVQAAAIEAMLPAAADE